MLRQNLQKYHIRAPSASTSSARRRLPRACNVHSNRRHFSSSFVVDNPYTGQEFCTIPGITDSQATQQVDLASKAFNKWRHVPIQDRIDLCNGFVKKMEESSEKIAKDITCQMGKPLEQALGEVEGCLHRARTMISLAPSALADTDLTNSNGKQKGELRLIAREPVGTVLCLSPWNYPLLCAVNVVVPAVLAGNSVLLKHSSRAPLCATHFEHAFGEAGSPHGLVQAINASHDQIATIIRDPRIGYVSFTGSVPAGKIIQKSVSERFIDATLELGGKDPAYVCDDADVERAARSLVDGAMYNAGQSCCSVERAYVHASLYDRFLEIAVAEAEKYTLGDPMDQTTSMGPMAQDSACGFLTGQVADAVQKGASLLCGGESTKDKAGCGRFFQPTILSGCSQDMRVITEESFGPILPVVKVESDTDAIQKMNDTDFGLTASAWTSSRARALKLCKQLDAGTVFHNRCDALDPKLPWSGRKDSGKGCSLSSLGFNALTRTKSYNFCGK
eukprot:405263_1